MSTIEITEIFWKRAKLNLRYQSDKPQILSLKGMGKTIPFECGEDPYTLEINISNVKGEMLPQDSWLIVGDGPIEVSQEILDDITLYDRVFRYGNRKSYNAWITCDEDGNLALNTAFMKQDDNPEKRGRKQDFMTAMANLEYRIFHGLSTNRNKKILFLSQTDTKFSDNMKAVYDRLMERGFDQEYTIDTELREEAGAKRGSLSNVALTRKIAGYNYLFVDNYVPIFTAVKPADDVRFIQLWHAGVGFKSVGYARFGVKGSPHALLSSHRRYTDAFVGNEKLIDVYSEVFGIPKDRFTATGLPRLEHFLDQDVMDRTIAELESEYPEVKGKRVILFAPTFRGSGQSTAFYDYSVLDLEALSELCKNTNSLILFKWHHFITDRMEIPEEYKECMLDVSHENLNNLMYISDVLITDYSSCYYDYLLLDRPIIFYMYDEDVYNASRGVGDRMSDLAPGYIARTMDELVSVLSMEKIEMPEARDYMVDQGRHNGDYIASDRIIDKVFGINRE